MGGEMLYNYCPSIGKNLSRSSIILLPLTIQLQVMSHYLRMMTIVLEYVFGNDMRCMFAL